MLRLLLVPSVVSIDFIIDLLSLSNLSAMLFPFVNYYIFTFLSKYLVFMIIFCLSFSTVDLESG